MRIEYKILWLSILLGLVFIVIESIYDYLFFSDASFPDILTGGAPGHDPAAGIIGFGLFVVFGLIVSRYAYKKNMAEHLLRIQNDFGIMLSAAGNRDEISNSLEKAVLGIKGIDGMAVIEREPGSEAIRIVRQAVDRQGRGGQESGGKLDEKLLISLLKKIPEDSSTGERRHYQNYPEVRSALDGRGGRNPVWKGRSTAFVPLFETDSKRFFLFAFSFRLKILPPGIRDTLAALSGRFNDAAGRMSNLEALRKSEANFRLISELTADYSLSAVIKPDGTYEIEWLTDALDMVFGYNFRELEESGGWIEAVYSEDREIALKHRDNLMKGISDTGEFRIINKTGEIIWLRNFGHADKDETSGEIRVIAAGRDVTRRKTQEESVAHLNDVLRAVWSINQSINEARDRRSLLEMVCRKLVETRGYNGAWGILFDEKGGIEIGAEEGIGERFDIFLKDFKNGRAAGCWKAVAGNPGIHIIKDKDDICKGCILSSIYRDYGVFSIRLEFEDRIYGLFTVYISREFIRNSEEQELFTEIARDIAFGIHDIELEKERKEAIAALEVSLKKYRVLFESFPTGITISDDRGNVLEVNRQSEKILDLPVNRHERRRIDSREWKLLHPGNRTMPPGEVPAVIALKENRLVANREMGVIKDNGEITWLNVTAAPIPLEGYGVAVSYTDITDRKKAEEALRKSQSRYKTIYDNTALAIFESTPDGEIINVNQACARMFGFDSPEGDPDLISANSEQVYVDPRDRERVLRRITDERGVVTFENRYRRRDGSEFIGELKAEAVRGDDGNISYIFGFIEDITRRKELEEELRRREEEFRTLAENAPDIVARFDREGRHLYVNPVVEESSGIKSSEYIGKTHDELGFDDEYCRFWHETIERIFATGKDEFHEFTFPSAAGVRQYDSHLVPEFGSDGKVVSVLGIIRDITERKLSEQAIRDREATLTSLFQAAPIGIGLVKNRVLKHVNERFCEIVGYSREELIDRDALMIYPDKEEYDRVGLKKYEQIDKYGRGTIETRFKRKNGKIVDILLSSAPIDRRDMSAGVTFTALDITQRKIAEATIRESEERYRRLVENSPIPVLVQSDYKFVYLNPEAIRVLGGETSRDFVGKPVWDFIHPDYRNIGRERLTKIYEKEQSAHLIEEKFVRLDGKVIDVEVMGAIIDFQGKAAAQVVFRDITDRKRAENDLKRSEEKYRNLVENINEVIYSTDEKGIITYISPAIESMTGYRPSELIGTNYIGYIFEGDRKRIKGRFRQLITGRIEPAEYRVMTKSGKTRWVRLSSDAIMSDRGFIGVRGVMTDIDYLKATEKALRESEERYHTIFDNNHTVMFLIDPKTGDIEDANPAACDFYGYTKEELVDLKLQDINILSDDEVFERMQKAVCDEGLRHISRHRLAGGEIRDVEIYSCPIQVGGTELLYSIVHDITDRKRAEKALQISEKKFRELFNHMTSGVAIFEPPDGGKQFVLADMNKAAERMIKLKKEEISENIIKTFPDLAESGLFDILGRVRKTGNPLHLREIYYKDSRLSMWVEVYAYNLPSGEIVLIFNDITEKKEAEEELRFLGSITKQVSDAIIATDTDFKIIFINEACKTLFGFNEKELKGKSPDMLNAEKIADDIQKEIYETVASGRSWSGQLLNRRKDGSTFTVDTKVSPLYDDAGRIYSYIGIVRDITHRIEAEEREREIQERLVQNEKLAFIGTMVAGVAHEINNPLAVLSGMLQDLVRKTDKDAPIYKKYFRMRKVSDRIAKTVDGLLQFSRQKQIVLAPTDINMLIEESLSLVQEKAAFEGIKMKKEYGEDIPQVNLEREKISQVIINLIRNALDSMRDGGTLTIASKYLKKKKQVSIAISDTGEGIDPGSRKKLFTPFYTTKDVGRGTGLGLAISYGIVESHQGFIDVKSEPGKGSTFTIFLPIKPKSIKMTNMLGGVAKQNDINYRLTN